MAYTIERWAREPEQRWQVVGRATNLAVAQAIFEAAARQADSGALVLRQGAAVLLRSGD
jgi:hypothetical protein